MKRNMVPLVGIAFVVAIISTGVFYGLFAGRLRSSTGDMPGHPIMVAARELDRGTVLQAADVRVSHVGGALSGSFGRQEEVVGATLLASVKENEPLLEDRLATRAGSSSGSGRTVPSGMRAVSIRIAESDGVANLVNAGSRIDIQAVSDKGGQAELRTILENVQVLAASPAGDANGGNRNGIRVVAVLVRAEDADRLALADSSARIRVTLRNPLDQDTLSHRPLALAALFRPGATQVESKSAVETPAPQRPVELHVEVLAASAAALSELNSKLNSPGAVDSIQVASFRAGAAPSELLNALKNKHELEIVSSRRLAGAVGSALNYRARAASYQLHIRFSPEQRANGNVNLRVTPELAIPSGAGVETRQYDAELGESADFLVQGLAREPDARKALERLFPGQSWSNRELVILVESRVGAAGSVAALSRTSGVR